MRALNLAAFALALSLASAAHAADTPRDIKGLYLLTDYPAITVRPGTTSTIPLRLQNYGLAPERYQLSVEGVPSGWTATLRLMMQVYGASQIALGSDYPFGMGETEPVAFLDRCELDPQSRTAILRENAERFLGLARHS